MVVKKTAYRMHLGDTFANGIMNKIKAMMKIASIIKGY
jgi:hypothetical protein